MTAHALTWANITAPTWTLASRASDTNLLAGRESAAVALDGFLDVLAAGKVTAGTSPTAARRIEIYAIGTLDVTPTWPDVFDGTDSDETITSADIKRAICRHVAIIGTSNTSDRTYPWGPVSLAGVFGGVIPSDVIFFLTHNTGVNLNSSAGNHALYLTGVAGDSQ